MLKKIISGGQIGVDRAALDAALETGFPCGGYCPKDRLAEDGPIDLLYPLTEIDGGYKERTRMNVEASDGTLIVYQQLIHGGTRLTLDYCLQLQKPRLLIDPLQFSLPEAAKQAKEWIAHNEIIVLNVAGPRESDCPQIYDYVRLLIGQICVGSQIILP
jgi:hypothetical protein